MAQNVVVPPFPVAPETVVGSTPRSVFDFDFPFWEAEDILVYANDLKIAATGYTVQGLAVQNGEPVEGGYGSGRVTLNAPVSNCTVKIDRRVKASRESAFGRAAPLKMTALNADLNKLTARQQDYERALRDVEKGVVDPDLLAEVVGEATSTKLEADASNAAEAFSKNAPYKPTLPTLPAPEVYTRPIGDKFDEARSLLDFLPYAVSQEIKAGTHSGEINARLQAALDTGEKSIIMPAGVYPIDTDGFTPIITTPGQRLIGQGKNSRLINQVVAGTPARPAFIINADDVELAGFEVVANTRDCVNPVMADGEIAMGVAVLVMGDRANVHHMIVRDSWDGGIAVGRYDLTTGHQTPGSPRDILIDWCNTFNTGRGIQMQGPLPLMAGSGINNLTGQGVRITNCTDYFSTQGFIADYAAGGFTFFGNCKSIGAKKSAAPGGAPNVGGQGFYIGAVATMWGCEAHDAQGDGFWIDGYSFYCIGRGLRAKGCRQRGLLLEGRDNDIEIAVDICSYENPGAYPAVQVRGAAAVDTEVWGDSRGQIIRAQTTGPFHSYGIKVDAIGEGGSLGVSATIEGGSLQGIAGPILNAQPLTVKEVGWTVRGEDQIRDNGMRVQTRTNASWQTQAFGDSLQNGHLHLADVVAPAKRLSMGFDPVNDVSVIQSMHAGVTPMPLELNPSGGEVRSRNTFRAIGGLITSGTTADGGVVGETAGSIAEVIRTGSAKKLAMGVAPDGTARLQAVEPGVGLRRLTLNDAGGDVQVGGETGGVWVNIPGTGLRRLELGAADSGGSGFRQVRVAN